MELEVILSYLIFIDELFVKLREMYTLTNQEKKLVVLDLKGTGLQRDKDVSLKKRKYSMPNIKNFFKKNQKKKKA